MVRLPCERGVIPLYKQSKKKEFAKITFSYHCRLPRVRDRSGSPPQGRLLVLQRAAATAGSPRTADKTTVRHKAALTDSPPERPNI